MMHGWGFAGGLGAGYHGRHHRFEEQYHCYSVAYADKSHLEKGDKILLPPSAFDTLARLQVDYPMLFRLSSETENRTTHCGVLEFTAEEGTCYIPFWMMQNLLIEEGAVITVTNVSLPKASFVKLQPQSVDFLEISNPRAVLENALRNFSCVTKGDVIQIPYNNKNYHFALKEVKPKDAACIIETDCNVDFDAPVGYKEPTPTPSAAASASSKDSVSVAGRSSACPSPSALSAASSATNFEEDSTSADSKPPGIRIVNGQVVRPDDYGQAKLPAMLAERTGATGVQRNAAIPSIAPKVDYWAVAAGDGSRLDGKQPAVLKDKDGTEVDIRKIRAEAAAQRLAEQQKLQSTALPQSGGQTLRGTTLPPAESSAPPAAAVPLAAPRRKNKIGGKYSTLKQSSAAFRGSANKLG